MSDFFEPIVGSSFDSLAAQRQFWAGLNNATATGNVNRAAQAQQEANNYFQQLAQSHQAAINRQAEMNWMGQQSDVAQQAAAAERETRAHQFDVNTQLSREDINRREGDTQKQIQKMDEATAEKAREFDLSTEQQKQAAADDLQNTGQALATTFAASRRQLEQATKAADDLQSEHDALTTEVSDLGKKTDKTPEDIQKLSADNARLAALKNVLPKALTVQNNLEQRHLALSDNIQARGFVTDEEKGSLTHLQSGKTWSFGNALKKATEQAAASAGTNTATNDYFSAPAGATQTATAGQPPLPPAPLDKTQRNVGATYLTPKGPMIWTGNGWQPAQTSGTYF